MNKFKVLKRIKLFEIYEHLNRENSANDRAVALREVDLTEIEKIRNSKDLTKVSYSAFMIKAAALTLLDFNHANRISIDWFFYKRMVQLKSINISIAVERDDASDAEDYEAAFIYTVYDADKKSLQDITREIQGISSLPIESTDPRLERWQRMKSIIKSMPFLWPIKVALWIHKNVPSSYLKNRGGALMISSPSKYGVDAIIAHWPYPLGLSFGLAKERPYVVNGELTVRKTFQITLAFDRRIISGSLAARFMNRLCDVVEKPDELSRNATTTR